MWPQKFGFLLNAVLIWVKNCNEGVVIREAICLKADRFLGENLIMVNGGVDENNGGGLGAVFCNMDYHNIMYCFLS